MIRSLVLLLFATIILGCSKDDDEQQTTTETPETGIDVVTGISLRDANGFPMGELGNPNTRPGDVSVFPNPAGSTVLVQANTELQKIWLIEGLRDTTFEQVNFESLLADLEYEPTDIDSKSVKAFNLSGAVLSLDLSDLTTGYYRIFYRLSDNSVFWDNIYLNQDNSFEANIQLLQQDWN